jgi:hypothetical protein
MGLFCYSCAPTQDTGNPMKRLLLAPLAMTLGLGLAILTSCGGGSSSTQTQPPPPSITSFTANSASITVGSSATLTGVFVNGTGVITPGNLPATSGVAVTVSPTTTTPYTLTVTPTSGTAVTATATITVNPAPTITSFGANSATITTGSSTTLTPVFANGTGVITPGNLTATSGTGITVSPTATTTYILTVTNASNTAVTATAIVTVASATVSSVTVDPLSTGPAVTNKLLGMNMAIWFDVVSNQTGVVSAFQSAGITQVRWPGGSDSDLYHWESNSACADIHGNSTYVDSNDTFANFVSDIAKPANLDVALTANYGSNSTCDGGGEPSEAADWATAALAAGITPSHITVGNEEYGSWEEDIPTNDTPDPTMYASAVVGASGYYSLIKAASPSTLVGIDVDADNTPGGWDNTVMANAKGSYDFVEYHYYPETPLEEDDTKLVQLYAQQLTTNINTLKSELAEWGTPSTPIYVGEIGGPYSNPGKQSWSIVQGLYAGQVLGEMMNAGVSRLTWWIGFGNCNGTNGNVTTSVYGWQDFGAYNVFSDGSTEDPTCPGAGPLGTMSPTARAFQLFSQMAVNGQTVLTPTVVGDTTDVRAYAATQPNGGTALFLFNDNETLAQPVTITLSGKSTSSSVTVTTYDKAIYDLSGSPTGTPPDIPPDPVGTNTWAAPNSTPMGAQTLPLTLTLTPWSMNMVIIQ